MGRVEILVGSPSDLPFLWESKLLDRLKEAGIEFTVSACSAHRNTEQLTDRIDAHMSEIAAYICAAGWAAALPGAVKALLLGNSLATVFGIALPSDEYPDGLDAEISIKRLPPGIDVTYGGVGVEGFNAIVDDVINAVNIYTPATVEELDAARAKIKPPWFDIPRPFKGKTKRIDPTRDQFVVNIVSMDDITAGDGAKHDVIEGKAAASTRHTCNVFELLERHGIATHFIKRLNDRTFQARAAEMLGLELIARRWATGSYLNRFPGVADGTRLEELVFEIFEKDDANHDPLLEFDFKNDLLRRFVPNNGAAKDRTDGKQACDLIDEETLSTSKFSYMTPDLFVQLRDITCRTFEIIELAWLKLGGVYIDFKVECGLDKETGKLMLADVIDSDSGRLRFGEEDMSKQSYRDGQDLPTVRRKFDEVAALTDQFLVAA